MFIFSVLPSCFCVCGWMVVLRERERLCVWCSPYGNLFCKLCLLENLNTQKKSIKRAMKAYEQQIAKLESDVLERDAELERLRVERFSALEDSVKASQSASGSQQAAGSDGVQKIFSSDRKQQQLLDRLAALEREKVLLTATEGPQSSKGKLTSFWIPSVGPDAKPVLVKMPDTRLRDPVERKPLKMKEIFEIDFRVNKERLDEGNLRQHDTGVYQCPSCGDTLSNTLSGVFLRRSRQCVCRKCYDLFVSKEMRCPMTGIAIRKVSKDVIFLKKGGTGFAAHDTTQLEASREGDQMGFA